MEENDIIFEGEWPPAPERKFLSGAMALLLILTLVTAAGAGLRLYKLGDKSLWVDEAISFALASTGNEPVEHPPLYFRLLGLTLDLVGSEEEWALRLLSALCGILAIPLIFFLGREAGDRWTGLVAALVLAFSPYHVQISQEARKYALLCLLALLFFLLQTVARRRSGAASLLAWIVSGPVLAAAFYTHHLSVLLVPASLLPLLAPRNRPWKKLLAAWLAALALGTLIYLPQLPRTLEQVGFHLRVGRMVEGERLAADPRPPPGPLARVKPALRKTAGTLYYMGAGYRYTDLSGGGLREALGRWPDRLLLPALVLLPLGAALLGLLRLWRDRRQGMVLLLAGTLLLVVGFGAFEGSPPNHLAEAFPCLAVLMAVGLRGGRGRFLPAAGLGLLATLHLLVLAGYYEEETYLMHRENWREAGRHLVLKAGPEDAVFVHGGRNSYFAMRYYYPGPAQVSCYLNEDQLFRPFFKEELEPFNIPEHLRALTSRHPRVWYLYSHWGSARRQEELTGLNR